MVHIWYRGMKRCLTVQLSSKKSWNRTQGRKKVQTHEAHSANYQELVLCPTNRAFSLSTPCHIL